MIDMRAAEKYRDAVVEEQIASQYRKKDLTPNLMAGQLQCPYTGRWVGWSIALDAKPHPELFLSTRDRQNPRANDLEVCWAIPALGLMPVREINATTERQNTIRGFYVKGKEDD